MKEYDLGSDNIYSILQDICCALHNSSSATFEVSGFGRTHWPVDIKTDFCILLEQVPAAIEAATNGSFFTIDFYEQGIERAISFTLEGEMYCAEALSWSNNNMVQENIPQLELFAMLTKIREDFLVYISQAAPLLSKHPLILDFFRLGDDT